MLVRHKHSSSLDTFLSYEKKEVLLMLILYFKRVMMVSYAYSKAS
jgi:hypothetical protein